MKKINMMPQIQTIEAQAATAADAIVNNFGSTGLRLADLSIQIKQTLLSYWYAGKFSGSKTEIEKVIELLQSRQGDVRVLIPMANGQFQPVSIQDVLLDRVRQLERGE